MVDETGEYELRLPGKLQPAPAGKYHFIHGGQTWENENLTVTLSYGHWAESSFAETAGTRCGMTTAGMKLFTISSPQHVLVWYQIKPGSHEPLLSARSKTADPRDLAGIALSLRRRKSVGP